jgi:hypothetical protein
VTTGQQRRFGNPHAILILSKLNFGNGNNHF